jgi:protein-tyrosine phosphatase
VREIYWIGDTPLAIMACPEGDEELENDLAEMKEAGVETVLSLLEDDEAVWLGLEEEKRLAEKAEIRFASYPIPDQNTPFDEKTFRQLVRGLAERVKAGEHIAIHCRGGIGRSTVAAACTLIEMGWTPDDALTAVETARGRTVPDTRQQKEWILNYSPEK